MYKLLFCHLSFLRKPDTHLYSVNKSCSFMISAKGANRIDVAQLTQTVERLILKENVGYFYVGGYGNFNRLAAMAVKRLKKRYPFILLMLVLPYHPSERPVPVPEGFDGTYYPEGMETVPKRYAIVRANRKMVETVDWLIAYVWHPASNSRSILEYAQRREKKGQIHIMNLSGGIS